MENRIYISKRLFEIAKLISGPVVADVGCDSANLAIWLVQNKNFSVYACDLRSGPLKKAAANVEKFGVCDRVKLIQTDGLHCVPSSVNDVVIAGLGGEQIERIVLGCAWLKNPHIKLILQPQSFVVYLKQRLSLSGFVIESQVCVVQKNKAYLIFVVKFCGAPKELSLKEALICGLVKSDECTRSWVKHQKQKLNRVLCCLKRAKQTPEVKNREHELESEVSILEEWLLK